MNFAFSEAQEELRRSVAAFLDRHSPPAEVRRLMATTRGYDEAVWAGLADQLGLQGLLVPVEHGGAGLGQVELVVALEEMGRTLFCAPFFSTVALATNAILVSGDGSARDDLLPGIARGQTIATVAVTEEGGRWDEEGVTLAATRSGGGWHLDGQKAFVVDGHVADLVLVAARTGQGVSLFAVDGDAPGLRRTVLPTMDQTRKQATLDLTGTPGRLIGREGEGWPVVARTLDRAAVALAAEQVGGAQRCLDMSVSYAKERVQFGRPIGSFQAVKHKCAEMLLGVESSRSALHFAAWAAAEDDGELPAVASMAKAWCSEAYFSAAAETIQIHGGVGFTWDHDAHLYFKRARSSQVLLGDPAYHRELLARRIGI